MVQMFSRCCNDLETDNFFFLAFKFYKSNLCPILAVNNACLSQSYIKPSAVLHRFLN